MNRYDDRYQAGKILADQLKSYANNPDVLILALPRGGVPVAYEIAKALSAPLDIFVVRKLGVPHHEELAFGAIASSEATVYNQDIIQAYQLSASDINAVLLKERNELARRESKYRGSKPFPDLHDKIIILVDDGIATGATMRVAIKALRHQYPQRIVLAVPVAAISVLEELSHLVDEIVCPIKPQDLYAVGAWYDNFSQTLDEEVFKLLEHN